jgi:predicted nucleotidyltransferase
MTDFAGLLGALVSARVEFILVGGVAATIHGSARLTRDVDIVYRRTPDNIRRLVGALSGLAPYLRGAPPGLPFRLDEAAVTRGLNFTLTTRLGDIDLFGEIAGGGAFEDLERHTLEVTVFGQSCRCLDLRTLIRVKRAAGRPRDLEAVAELERILEERREE